MLLENVPSISKLYWYRLLIPSLIALVNCENMKRIRRYIAIRLILANSFPNVEVVCLTFAAILEPNVYAKFLPAEIAAFAAVPIPFKASCRDFKAPRPRTEKVLEKTPPIPLRTFFRTCAALVARMISSVLSATSSGASCAPVPPVSPPPEAEVSVLLRPFRFGIFTPSIPCKATDNRSARSIPSEVIDSRAVPISSSRLGIVGEILTEFRVFKALARLSSRPIPDSFTDLLIESRDALTFSNPFPLREDFSLVKLLIKASIPLLALLDFASI